MIVKIYAITDRTEDPNRNRSSEEDRAYEKLTHTWSPVETGHYFTQGQFFDVPLDELEEFRRTAKPFGVRLLIPDEENAFVARRSEG